MNAFGCFDASGQWNSRMEDEEGVLEEYPVSGVPERV